jgi:hypothetical protein
MVDTYYMLVSVDITPYGMNLSCWICPDDFYMSEQSRYPYSYLSLGEFCNWRIRCNQELTYKLRSAIQEQADQICIDTQKRDNLRKIANRS